MRGQPGHLEFSVRSGAIQIAWNDEGLLTRVHIRTDGMQGDATEDSPWIPKRALRLIENMVDFFDRGTPLDQISWEDLAVSQWTDFQKKVYQATSLIPHGETRTYGWVAQKIGKTLACRAVGQALRKNPVPLLIPCHRVVSNHSLGGFMGEDDPEAAVIGLKRQLLDLEHDFKNPAFSFFGSASA
jgi:methylated-DNA-[protein]-cysteine S-methyltransferase